MIELKNIRLYHECPVPLSRIAETYALAYGRPFWADYWTWRFLCNPFSDRVYIACLLEEDVLASYYAVSPARLLIRGQGEYKVALSNMTMTHPTYRGRGCFREVAQVLLEQLEQDGYLGVFGFANHRSHYGFRKYLNWRDLFVTTLFTLRREKTVNCIRVAYGGPLFEQGPVDLQILREATELSYSGLPVSLQRSYEGLKWRLFDHPRQKYRYLRIRRGDATGILFYKRYGQAIDIMEFFYAGEPGPTGGKLLAEAAASLATTEDRDINLWSNFHSQEHLYLERAGFEESAFSGYFGFIPLSKDADIPNPEEWHIRFLDSDVY